jgi:hypothetical protein
MGTIQKEEPMPDIPNATDLPHLAFDFDEVAKLVDHARAAEERMPGMSRETDVVLVGDRGVYFMSAGRPALTKEGGDGNKVVYAQGCNPETDDFDSWWAIKNETFGGDDGVEPLRIGPMIDGLRVLPPAKRDIIVGFQEDRLVISIRLRPA